MNGGGHLAHMQAKTIFLPEILNASGYLGHEWKNNISTDLKRQGADVRNGCRKGGGGPEPELSGYVEGRQIHHLSDYKLFQKPANTADASQ